MDTRNASWRKEKLGKLDPNTLVKFDKDKYYMNSDECYTCCDGRLGCDACHKLECTMMDLYDKEKYFDTWLPLFDLDLRFDYHESSNDLETGSNTKNGSNTNNDIEKPKGWYYAENPTLELVYYLRNLDKNIKKNNIQNDNINSAHGEPLFYNTLENNKYSISGCCNPIDLTDSTILTNYFGNNKDITVEKFNNKNYYYIGKKNILLCPTCFMWLNYLKPDILTNFKIVNSAYLTYIEWLKEREDSLLVKND
ncbi:hypothetical protein Hokovirus_1_332 [Hokovirus HKV1]|uniref:Uncharacterized protein n=1 Tax=Hokovirus HKV1 TaxID=1977638 RepID=A0A1V0SFG9_9VIRU|nr:hypothetical protein Hokovirus_1_332 [Hokovirus HKV1]